MCLENWKKASSFNFKISSLKFLSSSSLKFRLLVSNSIIWTKFLLGVSLSHGWRQFYLLVQHFAFWVDSTCSFQTSEWVVVVFFNFLFLCINPYCSTSVAKNVCCQGKYNHLTSTLQFRVGGTPVAWGVAHHAGSHGLWGHPSLPAGGTIKEPAGYLVPAQKCQQLWHIQAEHKHRCLDPVNQRSFLLQLLCSIWRWHQTRGCLPGLLIPSWITFLVLDLQEQSHQHC